MNGHQKMKPFVFVLVIFILSAALFSGCSADERERETPSDSQKINIICTTFPPYDWTRTIIGDANADKFELTMLLDGRVDLHSYHPSVRDIARVKECDVFIFIGGESDGWVNEILNEANPDMLLLNLTEIFGGPAAYYDHNHEDCGEDHDHEHPRQNDEHIWLSLRNADLLCAEIARLLSELDPGSAQDYMDHYQAYSTKLSALDVEYRAAADAARAAALVFADRFPFHYLLSDYGLNHYAAFQGCSAETEASFVTIITLANRVNQYGLHTILVTESSNQSIAKTVIRETRDKNQQILILDSMQSITAKEAANGAAYLSIMENNLAVLKEALG
jgi:zinc transport system substrate-binding protein